MKTGEGKTLVATLPVYLNALAGKGVHVVTVNDYLAQRDAQWMGEIYKFLGLTVGCIVHGLDDAPAPRAICLRRHLRHQQRARLRLSARQHEVPSRGDGAARPPLCHRRRGRLDPDRRGAHAAHHLRRHRGPLRPLYHHRRLHPALDAQDFEVDEKMRSANLTEVGNEHMEELLRAADLLQGETLYDIENVTIVHHVNQALKAHKLFQRDRDYIVKDDR
jgi:preprotein translocase subunit SecA